MRETKPKQASSSAAIGVTDQPTGLPLEDAIRQKTAKIGVIGLGYVGLPLIRTFVAAGFQTLGFDVDAEKVESLQAGRSYIEHIPSEWIGRCVERRQVCAHGRHEPAGRGRRPADLRAHAA